MGKATDEGTAARPSVGGHAASDRGTYVSHRPAWGGSVRVEPDCITYCWTAPTTALEDIADVPDAIRPGTVSVDLMRIDDLDWDDNGVKVKAGSPVVFLLDTNFDVENARKLAAAIVEACDHFEQSQG